jgi:uncharacterized membrane protein
MAGGWSEAPNRVEASCAIVTIIWNTFTKCYPKVSVHCFRRNVPRRWWRWQGLDRLDNYPMWIISSMLRFYLSTVTLHLSLNFIMVFLASYVRIVCQLELNYFSNLCGIYAWIMF